MSSRSHSDLATLAHLARDGSLDLTAVAFRVKTDLLVASQNPAEGDLRDYTEFALAALPRLGERDLKVISDKLAEWPHTPLQLKQALIERFPVAQSSFDAQSAMIEQPASAHNQNSSTAQTMPSAKSPEKSPAHHSAAIVTDNHAGKLTHNIAASQKAQAERDADDELRAKLVGTMSATDDAGISMAEGSDFISTASDTLGLQIDLARNALESGHPEPARALLARSDLRAADHAAFFLLANPVQQSLILSGLEQLQKLQPHTARPRMERETVEVLMSAAGIDKAGAFLGLAEQIGGTPEFAAAMTLDASRKLTGLTFLALGASVEDAVRFAIKLGDESSASVSIIFSLVETLRAANPATALRLVRAIGASSIKQTQQRVARHIPAVDPSSTPNRTAQTSLNQEKRGINSPLQTIRALTGS